VWALLVFKELKVFKDLKGNKALLELQVISVLLAFKDLKVFRVLKELKV
jgi:hypothetical protein